MTQEQLRMQMLAGIITEGQYKAKLNEESTYNDNSKALGTIFQFNSEEDEYEWIGDEYEKLRQDLGIDEENWDELHHYTSLMDRDEMGMYRGYFGNNDLTPEDITIGMMKQHYQNEVDRERDEEDDDE